jgi:hypothetical protein
MFLRNCLMTSGFNKIDHHPERLKFIDRSFFDQFQVFFKLACIMEFGTSLNTIKKVVNTFGPFHLSLFRFIHCFLRD